MKEGAHGQLRIEARMCGYERTAAVVIRTELLFVTSVMKTVIEVTVYRSPDSMTAFMTAWSRLGWDVVYNGANVFFPRLSLSTRQIRSTIMAR